jgi:hypothetical protein
MPVHYYLCAKCGHECPQFEGIPGGETTIPICRKCKLTMTSIPAPPPPPAKRRVVLRPLMGPDFITDIWSDVAPKELVNSMGTFRLIREGTGYMLYQQAEVAQ